MEQKHASSKKRLKRPKNGKQRAEKPKKRRSAFQMAVQFLQQPDPERDKREKELRRKSIEPEILMIEGAATLLGCSVQRIRGISPDELRRIDGPGRGDLFLKEDLIDYARRHPKHNPTADDLMREIEIDELESVSDSGSRRRGKRRNRDVKDT